MLLMVELLSPGRNMRLNSVWLSEEKGTDRSYLSMETRISRSATPQPQTIKTEARTEGEAKTNPNFLRKRRLNLENQQRRFSEG